MSSKEVVVFQHSSPVAVVGQLSVLGGKSKATSNTVEDGDGGVTALLEGCTTGGLLDVVVLVFGGQGHWSKSWHLRVIHHLRTTSADTNRLPKMSAFFDVTEELLTNALYRIVMGEVTVHSTVPPINVLIVFGGMAKPPVALMTTKNSANRVPNTTVVRHGVVVKTPSVLVLGSDYLIT